MKFTVTFSASGAYCTANGKTVSLSPATSGKDYANEAAAAADLKLTPRALFFAMQTKLNTLARAAEAPVTVGALVLKSDADSQSQFNNLVTLLQLARDAQPDDTHKAALLAMNLSAVAGPIIDADGVTHNMTVSEAFALVLAYGQALGAARATMLTKQAAVRAATTVEAVAAI